MNTYNILYNLSLKEFYVTNISMDNIYTKFYIVQLYILYQLIICYTEKPYLQHFSNIIFIE